MLGTERHIVIAGPHRVNVLVLHEQGLHDFHRLLAIPHSRLARENLNARIGFENFVGRIDAVGVDRTGNAFQHNNLALTVQLFDHKLGGLLTECFVVPFQEEVSHGFQESAVDIDQENSGFVSLLGDRSQWGAFGAEHD